MLIKLQMKKIIYKFLYKKNKQNQINLNKLYQIQNKRIKKQIKIINNNFQINNKYNQNKKIKYKNYNKIQNSK